MPSQSRYHKEPVNVYNAYNYTTKYFNGSNSGVLYDRLITNVNYGDFLQDGWYNPEWKNRVLHQLDASSQYVTSGYVKLQPAHISGYSLVRGNGGVFYESTGYTHISRLKKMVRVDDPATSDLALQRLKRKLQRHAGEYNALVPIVELRELRGTIVQLAKLSTGYLKHYASLRRKLLVKLGKSIVDPHARARMIRNLQDSWLTWSFGVSPLVSDAQKALEAVELYLARSDHNIRLVGSAETTWMSGDKGGNQTALYACPLSTQLLFSHSLEYRWIAAAKLQLLSSNNYSWDSTFGFQESTLPSLFYELTPFSWVLDYFTTMGEYLDDTFVLPPGDTYYIVRCSRYEVTSTETPYYVPIVDPSLKECRTTGLKTGESKFIHFARDVGYQQLPRVGIHLKSLDQIGGKNEVKKLLNLASVLKFQ